MYSLDFCRQVTPVSGSYWKQSTAKFKRNSILADKSKKMLRLFQ